jgi:outer membrane receptor protein involved in Fe transport
MAIRTTRLQRSPLCLALIAALAIPAGAAFAQSTTAPNAPAANTTATTAAAPAGTAKKLEKVSVVGSMIDRATIEGPAPVTVITREDIDREGYQTVGEMLQSISQNTTGSFTGDLAVTGFTPNALVVNLRNLGPGYTLTLVNGRRPAQYPQPYNRDNNVVNVRAIPSSIVERVEVLTGGASALYGSDAVAGVVNIVTRTNYDGQYVNATIGRTQEGGGASEKIEYTGGSTGDRYSAVWALQYSQYDAVFASQRKSLESTLVGPRGYIPGVTNPALSQVVLRSSNGTVANPLNFNNYYNSAACDAFGYTTVTSATRGKYCGSFTQPASRSILNAGSFYSLYGHGTFDLTDNLELFGSATYYSSDGKSSSGTEFWGTSGDQFMRSQNGAARATYFDPQFGALEQLQRVFNPFELGGPEAATTLYDEETWDLSGGIRGTLWNDRFDWEASLATSRYEYSADRPRLLAQAVHDYFLDPCATTSLASCSPTATQGYTNGAPIYRLDLARWDTPITQDIYQSFATRAVNVGKTESSTANFIVKGDLWEMSAGAVGFAGGFEWGTQKTDLESDPRTDPNRPRDNQTIYNLTSSGQTHGKRDRYAAFGELRVPILDTLTAQIAARYDKYDDITAVDDAISYNLGLEYRPWQRLLLRTTYATSFRAPDMQLVFAEGAASFSTIFDEYACRTGTGLGAPTPPVPRSTAVCKATSGDRTTYSSQTLIAGNPNLKEEEGKSFGAGFVWDITKGMNVSVDYWRIKLEDAASQLSTAYILRKEADCRLGIDEKGEPVDSSSALCVNILGLVTRNGPEPGTTNDLRLQRVNSAYINTALTDINGIDTSFKYNWQAGVLGHFYFDFQHSLTLHNKYRQFDTDDLVDYRNDERVNDQRSRAKASLSWVTPSGHWTSTLTGTRSGTNGNNVAAEYTDLVTNAHEGARLPPYFIYNLTVKHNWTEKLDTQLTINNLTNNQYRHDNSFIAYPFFDTYIGADPLGRRFFLSVGYKF